jgi:hypothetical protein
MRTEIGEIMFDRFGNKARKESRIVNPYDLRPTKAKITIDVDLVTQQVALTCDKTLPGLMIANILCQAASGYLMEMQKLEAMIVGRRNHDNDSMGGPSDPGGHVPLPDEGKKDG